MPKQLNLDAVIASVISELGSISSSKHEQGMTPSGFCQWKTYLALLLITDHTSLNQFYVLKVSHHDCTSADSSRDMMLTLPRSASIYGPLVC